MSTQSCNLSTVSDILCRRRSLKVAVASLCHEVGFSVARDSAIETLTEMMQSFLTELAQSAQGYCELSGRTEPLPADVIMALVEMGVNVDSIPNHARRPNKTVGVAPGVAPVPGLSKHLQTGDIKAHPSHIPDHLPPFPDPHTYIKTLTHKQPGNEYQVVREKAASQKRDVERALTRFIAKTGQVQSVLKDDVNAFPLISVKPEPLPYLTALMPDDYDLTDASTTPATTQPSYTHDPNNDADIDNPYIRPVKMPRLATKRL